jgi:MarR family transcriptional regulator, lower aerobic nicotinate degradation pathway regulator
MLDRTTTTGALKRLQSRKFIARTVDRRDRRAQMCRLTKSGERLLRRIEAPARAAHRETLQGLSKTEQRQLIAMMRKVVAPRAKQECTTLV